MKSISLLRTLISLPLAALLCTTVGCTSPSGVAPASTSSASAQAGSATSPGASAASSAPVRGRCDRTDATQHLQPAGVSASSGPLALARWGDRAVVLIADEDEQALQIVDASSLKALSLVELPAPPSQLLVLADGRIAMTFRYHNRVALLQPAAQPEQGMTLLCIEAPVREPLALAEHGDALFVLAGAGGELVRLDAASLTVRDRVPLAREPRGLLISRDGGAAWVSHMAGNFLSKVDLSGTPTVSKVAIHRGEPDPESPSRNSQGFALARYVDDNGRAVLFAPHINSDVARSGRSFGYGGGRTQHMMFALWTAVIDEDSGKFLGNGRERHRLWRRLCGLPRAALVREERLWVACLDEGTVVEMDARFSDPTAAVRRVYRVADGPNGLAMSKIGELFIWSSFGHELTRIAIPPTEAAADVSPPAHKLVVARRKQTEWKEERLDGRRLFHATRNDRISRRGASCASCHPDGRDDGLTWARMATLSLAGRVARKGPFGWRSEDETLDKRVQETARDLLGKGFGSNKHPSLGKLVSHLRRLREPPPPLPHTTAEGSRIERGEAVFHGKLSCSACHPKGEGSTARFAPDNANGGFDFRCISPSLRNVGISPPYFHDNRYATLQELLSDPKMEMANVQSLAKADRSDLVAFMEALPHGVVSALPQVAEANAWVVRSAQSSDWTGTWQAAGAPLPVDEVLSSAPGRHLVEAPQKVDVDKLPQFIWPHDGDKYLTEPWLSGRDHNGAVVHPGDRYWVVSPPGSSLKPDGRAIPHVIVSNHDKLRLEVQPCPLVGPPISGSERDGLRFSVRCKPKTQELPVAALGAFGFGARAKVDGKNVLWVIAPQDDVWGAEEPSGERYVVGPVKRHFWEGAYDWMSLHYLPLEPGTRSLLLRLQKAHPQNWIKSGLPKLPEKAVISVVWPEGAAKPTIMVGEQ